METLIDAWSQGWDNYHPQWRCKYLTSSRNCEGGRGELHAITNCFHPQQKDQSYWNCTPETCPLVRQTEETDMAKVRTFDTGATRDTEDGKLDYEGFLSGRVLKRYAEYMHKHRIQTDGTQRDSDNWQRGIPRSAYMKSKWRHFMDTFLLHRDLPHLATVPDLEESLCAELFNTMGYLHELLKERDDETVSR